MRKRGLLKTGLLVASFAAIIPAAKLDANAAETDVAEVDAVAEVAEAAEAEEVQETDVVQEVTAPANGWQKTEDGRYMYYVEDIKVTNQVMKIDGAYYGFDWNGYMYDDATFSFYDYETGTSTNYRAKAGGKLYAGEWYKQDDYNWYYYTKTAKAADGVVKVGTKSYLFGYAGRLQMSYYGQIDGKWVVSDADGVATVLSEGDGWKQANGNYYYVKDGELATDKVLKIGKNYYYFNHVGVMAKGYGFSRYDYDLDKSFSYRATDDGPLYVNAWYENNNGWSSTWHYYGADGKAAEGLTTIGGKKYIFQTYDNGMYTDQALFSEGIAYVVGENGVAKEAKTGWNQAGKKYYYFTGEEFFRGTVMQIGSDYYGFNDAGVMYDNETFSMWDENYETKYPKYYRAKPGGKLYKSTWYYNYYYSKDGSALEGLRTVAKKQYYFVQGKALQGEYFTLNGELYFANASCIVSKVTKDGFYYHNAVRDKISYVSGGKVLKSAWKKVGGQYYYFDADGYAVVNDIYEIDGKMYLFDLDGTLAGTKGWKRGNEFYVTGSGALAVGEKKIGNDYYYFNEMGYRQSGLIVIDGEKYLYGPDGKYIGKASGSGWNEIKGTYYYVKKDGSVAEGLLKIGKQEYYFGYDGRMLTDTIQYIDDQGSALFKADGKRLQNGWYQIDGKWYYAKDGFLVNGGIVTIDGKDYMFDYSYRLVTRTNVRSDKLVSINTAGAITSQKKMADGWTLADGNYYYFKDGSPYTGWVGNYYISGGVMRRNTTSPDGYWLRYDGQYQKTQGWAVAGTGKNKYENGYYVKKNGKLAKNEWLEISGKWYYFGDYYSRYTGVCQIDGVWYVFDYEGVYLKEIGKTLPNGWVEAGSNYYYFESGDFVDGEKKIGGKTYTFRDSFMVKNDLHTNSNVGAYYSDSNGVDQTSYKGWMRVNGNWFYFMDNNKADSYGWTVRGTSQCYISYGAVTGDRVISGKLYTFNSDGVLVKEHAVQNGWYKTGGKYYYFKDGEAERSTLVTEKGKTYLIGSDGALVTNNSSYATDMNYSGGIYYANANGEIVTNTWKKVDDEDRYFGEDGRMLTGIWKIGGKVYFFD